MRLSINFWAIKWFALSLVMGFLIPRGGAFLLADVTSIPSDYDAYDSVDEAMEAYHLATNAIVNYYLENLMDPDAAEYGYVSYPPEDSECEAFGKNVSTYCLAVVLDANLKQYQIYLAQNRDKLNTSFDADGEASGVLTLEQALEQATVQRTTFEDQAALSEDALDLTLAVYNQVQVVYPVHEELTTVIRNLEDYRNNLARLRTIVEKYPSKFNGASTAQCQ